MIEKNKLKVTVKIICILIFALLISGNTFAAENSKLSFEFNATPNKQTVAKGDTVTITMKISNIKVGESGINTFSCKLKYDENVFEDLSINSKNNWSITYNNEKDNSEYGKMLAVLLETGVTEDQEIGEITLKAKKDIKLDKTQIEFTENSTNNGETIVEEKNKTVTLKISDEIVDNGTSETSSTTLNGISGLKQKQEAIKFEDAKQSSSISLVIRIVILVALIISASIYAYKKSKKSKKNK